MSEITQADVDRMVDMLVRAKSDGADRESLRQLKAEVNSVRGAFKAQEIAAGRRTRGAGIGPSGVDTVAGTDTIGVGIGG